MAIHFDESFVLPISRSDLWTLFWDIPTLAGCVPGCESADEIEPHKHYDASVQRKLGPFLMRMQLHIEIIEAVPEQKLVVKITGKDKKLRSNVEQNLTVMLSDEGAGTKVELHSEVTLSGMLGKLGETLIRTQLDATVREFFDNLRATAQQRA